MRWTERYRWLRDQRHGELAICAWDEHDADWAWDTRAAPVVDAEIDAAMVLHNAKLNGGP
jgi:hypothetical protein